MSTQISNKKLKAIVFTDIVNFTQLSAKDEQHALELIDKQREIVKPIVEKHSGEWLKEIGDGLLFSFDSSLDAVRCSIKIQESLRDIDDFFGGEYQIKLPRNEDYHLAMYNVYKKS